MLPTEPLLLLILSPVLENFGVTLSLLRIWNFCRRWSDLTNSVMLSSFRCMPEESPPLDFGDLDFDSTQLVRLRRAMSGELYAAVHEKRRVCA